MVFFVFQLSDVARRESIGNSIDSRSLNGALHISGCLCPRCTRSVPGYRRRETVK
jgi:hypothetical protein